MKTFKALAALLQYPEPGLIAALDEIEGVIAKDDLLSKRERSELRRLCVALRSEELMCAQENYVALFDRIRSLSLHLFEHVHGESRDRGQAMVDLQNLYAARGLELADNELPDFLPAFLEYLSLLPYKEAITMLEDTLHILEGIAARLAKRGSPYAGVFHALLDLAGRPGLKRSVIDDAELRREEDPAELDKVWQEQPAFCGAPPQPQVSVIQFQRRTS